MKSLFLLLMISCMAGVAEAQKSRTIYFNSEGKAVLQNLAHFYSTVTRDEKDTTVFRVQTFQTVSGRISGLGNYRALRFPVSWERLHEPTFRDAVKEGLHKEYHKNGKLSFEGTYKSGRPVGKHTRWYETGSLLSEGTMTGEPAEGTVLVYFESGKRKSQYTVKGGSREGELVNYHEDGKEKSRIPLKNGKRVGEAVRYDNMGRKIPNKD